jgi:putative DNA primase/helicase
MILNNQLDNKIKFSLNCSYNKNTNEKKYLNIPNKWIDLEDNYIFDNHNSIAILTGKINNIIVIDFDKEEGLRLFNEYYNLFQNTFIETSTRNYKHVYFKYDEDLDKSTIGCKLSQNIDILSNKKFCVIGTPDNNNEIQNIPHEFKQLLLNGNLEINKEFTFKDEYKDLSDLLDILPEDYYNNYINWVDCGMLINNATNHDNYGFELWEYFSKIKNNKKFIKNEKFQMIRLWDNFKIIKNYNYNKIYNYIESTENDFLIKQLANYNIKYNHTIIKNSMIINYFDNDDYYFNDFKVQLISNKYNSLNELLIFLKDNLRRVLVFVNDNIIKKINEEQFFDLTTIDKAGLKHIKINIKDENNTYKKFTLYNIIIDNLNLFHTFNGFKTNFDFTYSNKKYFYMSRKFKAKQLETYNMEIIQEILNFINEVFCNNDENIYSYFIKWLSFILKYPNMKSGKAVILYSQQGTGKGTIIDFLCNYIFGDFTSIPNTNFDNVVGKNNFHLIGKKLICVNELSTIKEEFKAKFDNLKTLVTENKISVKKLYCDNFTAETQAEYIFMTNNKYSFNIEKLDRRYLLLDCSEKYLQNTEFFSKFRENNFNQNTANHLYTYLLTILETPNEFLKLQVPSTKYKEILINTSQNSIFDYIEFLEVDCKEYFKNKLSFNNEDNNDNDNDNNLFIEPNNKNRYKASDLYANYVNWCKLNGERIQSNKWFAKNLLDNGYNRMQSSGFRYYFKV